jgi:hypothetical protein
MRTIKKSLLAALAACVVLPACTDDPQYVDPQMTVEVDPATADPDAPPVSVTIQLPIRLEDGTPEQNPVDPMLEDRTQIATDNMLGVDEVPYVRRDDMSVSIEWTIKNLEDAEGTARIHINGANEWFSYVPNNFVFDPEEDEEPPPLLGDIPLIIGAGATVSGVFREDQLREAAIDLELITRAATNPFAAVLQIHKDSTEFMADTGTMIPDAAFAHMVQFEVAFIANRHMVLEFNVRIRDHRGILHDELLDAPLEELTVFTPAEFQPPPPMVP